MSLPWTVNAQITPKSRAMITNALRPPAAAGVVEVHEWDGITALLAPAAPDAARSTSTGTIT